MEKSISKSVKKNEKSRKDIKKLIILTSDYLKKLSQISNLNEKKLSFVSSNNYEKASIERNNELVAFGEANSTFKKMKSLRKKINTDSNAKQNAGGFSLCSVVSDDLKKLKNKLKK